MTSIYSLSVTQNWREIQISLEFEIEFVEPNFGAKISLIMISEFLVMVQPTNPRSIPRFSTKCA